MIIGVNVVVGLYNDEVVMIKMLVLQSLKIFDFGASKIYDF